MKWLEVNLQLIRNHKGTNSVGFNPVPEELEKLTEL